MFSLSRDREPEKETEAEKQKDVPSTLAVLPPKPAPGVSSSGPHLAGPSPPRTQSQWQVLSGGRGAAAAQLCWHRQEWHFPGREPRPGSRRAVPRPRSPAPRTQVRGTWPPTGLGGQTSTREFPQALRHLRDSTSVQGCSGRVPAPQSTCLPCSVLTWPHSGSSSKSTEGWAPGRPACGRAGWERAAPGLSSGASCAVRALPLVLWNVGPGLLHQRQVQPPPECRDLD